MARPDTTAVSSGTQGWDGRIDDNFNVMLDAPFPIYQSALTTLAALTTAFPVAAYDRCFCMLNLTTFGYTLVYCDGAAWRIFSDQKRTIRSSAITATQLITDKFMRFTGAGAITFNFLAVASWPGETITLRNDTAGVVTMDPNGAQLINGAATLNLAAGSTATVYNDGTVLYASIQT